VAIKFKEINWRDWMWDNDIFGVQNPLSKEIGYCSVMGRGRTHFGLTVYLGSEGLESLEEIFSSEAPSEEEDDEILFRQKCLTASFEDRKFLKEPDLKIIKELGLKFRGKNTYPLFRSYKPGYYPWYLTQKEADYLTLAIGQAIEVALRFKENPSYFAISKDDEFLVRVREESGQWIDKRLAPPLPPAEREIIATTPPDQKQLEKIKAKITRRGGVFEIDFFYFPILINFPILIKDAQRPYFPYSFLVVDQFSSFIFDSGVMEPKEFFLKFPSQFLDLLERIGFLPKEIWAKKDEIFQIMEPIAEKLEIKLKWVKKLKTLQDLRILNF